MTRCVLCNAVVSTMYEDHFSCNGKPVCEACVDKEIGRIKKINRVLYGAEMRQIMADRREMESASGR